MECLEEQERLCLSVTCNVKLPQEYPRDRSHSLRSLRSLRKTTTFRYSVYLFFRYKSTNTDAGAGAMQYERGKELGLFIPLPMRSANQHAAFEGSLSSLSSTKTKHVSLVAKASYTSSVRPHTLVA